MRRITLGATLSGAKSASTESMATTEAVVIRRVPKAARRRSRASPSSPSPSAAGTSRFMPFSAPSWVSAPYAMIKLSRYHVPHVVGPNSAATTRPLPTRDAWTATEEDPKPRNSLSTVPDDACHRLTRPRIECCGTNPPYQGSVAAGLPSAQRNRVRRFCVVAHTRAMQTIELAPREPAPRTNPSSAHCLTHRCSWLSLIPCAIASSSTVAPRRTPRAPSSRARRRHGGSASSGRSWC